MPNCFYATFCRIVLSHPWGRGLLGVVSLLFCFCSTALADAPDHVLLLNSYHPGLAWTDAITQSIQKVLNDSGRDILLHIEYLDSKRNPDSSYLLDIADRTLQHKLKRRSFDLIIVSDNDALEFILRHRQDMFAGIPVVFCGINFFQPAMLGGARGFTGVAELPSFEKTLNVALQLQPLGHELVVIGRDDNVTGRLNNQMLMVTLRSYQQQFRTAFWNDIPLEKIVARLPQLSRHTFVLLASNVKDAKGHALSFAESAERISSASSVPIYGLWDFFLGHGIVGGHLINGATQGQQAGEMALQVLAGKDPAHIPVIYSGANAFMFDYRELERFGIAVSALPSGSIVLNEPPAFYRLGKEGFFLWLIGTLILLTGICVMAWSVKRRRAAENALRQSEERLRLALEGSQDGMWDWDLLTGVNVTDERWCSMLGYTKEEIENSYSQWEKLVHPDDLAAIKKAHQDCLDGLVSHFASEFRMKTKTGQWKWILGRGKVVTRDRAGRPVRLAGTHKDIHFQKETEFALKDALAATERARDQMDAIVKSIGDGLLVTNLQGIIILINPSAEHILGVPLTEALCQPIERFIREHEFHQHLASARACDDHLISKDLELFNYSQGEVRIFQAHTCRVKSRYDATAAMVTVLQDVTRIRESDRMKSEFISTAAHELRTPLTSVIGFAELLMMREDFNAEERREYLALINEKGRALEKIIDELLDLSRIESGRLMSLDKSFVKPGVLIRSFVDQYQRISPQHSFILELPSVEPELYIDLAKIGQVMENLFSNAVKYSPKGGAIHIDVVVDQGICRIAVRDEGIGMLPEQVERVFDKFYRADQSNTAIGGLGLGMAIAKHIVEAHQGRIWVDSLHGKGTTVTFTLPL